MKHKHLIWAVLAALVVLAAAIVLTVPKDPAAQAERFTRDTLAYLKSQEIDWTAPDVTREDTNPTQKTGGVLTDVEFNTDYTIDLLLTAVENAVQVRQADTIPELAPPRVTCGERFVGNYEKLYYTYPGSRRIVEFTPAQAGAMALSLYVGTRGGPIYPEVRDYFVSELADYLQRFLPEDGEDRVEVDGDGRPEAFDIRTQETLDWYMDLVRNHTYFVDYWGVDCIWSMPPSILVGGKSLLHYDYFSFTSPSTRRLIGFRFQDEASRMILDRINELAGWEESDFS